MQALVSTFVRENVNRRPVEVIMSAVEPMHVVLGLPAVVGLLVAAVNSPAINAATEAAEAWIHARERDWRDSDGRVRRYLLRPPLLIVTRLAKWTSGIAHSGLRSGLRLTASLYAVVAWLLLLYVAVQVVVAVALAIMVLAGVLHLLTSGDDSDADSAVVSRRQRVLAAVPPGHRVDPDTGRIQEEGLFGWSDTDHRVDPTTGNVQREGFLGWEDTRTRIDQSSGVVQREGFLGYRDTDSRIDPERGVVQEEGLLGWRDTDERIDPKTGRRQRMGVLGWRDA